MTKCALIVSERSFTRQQLRQLALNSEVFSRAIAKTSLDEAQRCLAEEENPYDFIFLGSSLGKEAAALLIDCVRSAKYSHGAKLVLAFEEQAQSSVEVAANMMVGFHSFICEPFSTEGILEAADLAQKVSEKETLLRLKAAAGLMLSDLHDEPETDCEQPPDLWQKAQTSCAWYNNVTAESLTRAVEIRLSRQQPLDRLSTFEKIRNRVAQVRLRLAGRTGRNLPNFRHTKGRLRG